MKFFNAFTDSGSAARNEGGEDGFHGVPMRSVTRHKVPDHEWNNRSLPG